MIVKKQYRGNNLYFLAPAEIYDKFILGVCYQSLRIIYDAIKIMEYINSQLDIKKNGCINDSAIDIFCYNYLYESFESNKFIYCNTNFDIDELE